MTIRERIERSEQEDAIYLGNLITDFKKTEAYDLIFGIVDSLVYAEIDIRESDASSDRKLGRCEGLRMLRLQVDTLERIRDINVESKKAERKGRKSKESEFPLEPGQKIGEVGGI